MKNPGTRTETSSDDTVALISTCLEHCLTAVQRLRKLAESPEACAHKHVDGGSDEREEERPALQSSLQMVQALLGNAAAVAFVGDGSVPDYFPFTEGLDSKAGVKVGEPDINPSDNPGTNPGSESSQGVEAERRPLLASLPSSLLVLSSSPPRPSE